MKADIRTVQHDCPLVHTIIQMDLETAGCSYDKLVAFLVCMGTAALSAGDVIEVENAVDFEGNMHVLINVGEVSFGMMTPVQLA